MKKLVKLAFLNNYRRISRTVLALLGIIIGIASLILLVSVVDGLHKDMSDTISKMQGIMVYADAIPSPMFGTLSSSYVSKLNSIAGTKKVIPEVMHLIGEVNNKKQDFQGPGNSTVIIGVNAKDFDDSLYGGMIDTILKGSKLKESDAGFILISDKFAEDYKKTVGSSIDLDDKSFKIKGIFKSNSQTTESMIFANPDDIRKLYDIPNDEINYITVVPQNPSDTDKIKDIIEFRFNDLQAKTSQELIEQIGSILDNLKLLVIVIAIVAAIVAGIGVINTMLMSVMERTKEIGTLKAVGWTKENIILLIILESVFIGIIGGIIGIVLSYLGSYFIVNYFDFPSYITIATVVKSFLFAFFIGLIGGLYPAWIASKQDPVEALRAD